MPPLELRVCTYSRGRRTGGHDGHDVAGTGSVITNRCVGRNAQVVFLILFGCFTTQPDIMSTNRN